MVRFISSKSYRHLHKMVLKNADCNRYEIPQREKKIEDAKLTINVDSERMKRYEFHIQRLIAKKIFKTYCNGLSAEEYRQFVMDEDWKQNFDYMFEIARATDPSYSEKFPYDMIEGRRVVYNVQ